ncbi:MAG: ligand-binding sensor domain-containing protein, partial [Candidatus Kariarchaeaceae archaeon]
MPSKSVNQLYEDSKGILWIGTESGLCKFDRQLNRFEMHKFGNISSPIINHASIKLIFEDNSNQLLVVTNRNGVLKIDKNREKLLTVTNKFDFRGLRTIFQDNRGLIWIGIADNGVANLIPTDKSIQYFSNQNNNNNSLSNNKITSLYEDKNGSIWIGTSAGILNKFHKEENSFIHYQFDSNRPILDIEAAPDGDLWLARKTMLTKFNPDRGEFKHYLSQWLSSFTYINPKIYNWIDDLVNQNRLIISIEKVQNNQHIERKFKIDNRKSVLIIAHGEAILNNLYDKAWILEQNSKNKVWEMAAYKTYYAGGSLRNRIQLVIITINPGNYEVHYQSDSKHAFGEWVKSPPSRPELWGISVFTLPDQLPADIDALLETNNIPTNRLNIRNLNDVEEDIYGQLWCLIDGQLHSLDKQNNEFILFEIKINKKTVTDLKKIYIDKSGVFWLGTDNNGLIMQTFNSMENKVETKQFLHHKRDPESISSNRITSIFQDKNDRLWIGTDMGLNRFYSDTKTFRHFTMDEGLVSNLVYGVLEDRNNNIWISTNKGLSKLNSSTMKIVNYTERDGLPAVPFTNSSLLSNTGEMYFGGNEGLLAIFPDSLRENLAVPAIYLTDFKIFNKSIVPGSEALVRSVNYSKEISLDYDQKLFS